MSTRHLLSKDEFRAIVGVTPAAGGTVTLFGKQVPWQPLSVGHYCQHVLGRFESARSFYVLGSQIAMARDVLAAVEAEGREPTEEQKAELDRLIDRQSYLEAQCSDAAAANMAFIAAGLGHGGDTEVETWLLGGDDDELMAALTTIEEGTWGADPTAFFARVGRKMQGRPLEVMARHSTTDASTKPTTKTASKATTPSSQRSTPSNRKARRTAKAAKGRAARG